MAFHDLSPLASRALLLHDYGSTLLSDSANPAASVEKSGDIVRYKNNFTAIVRTPVGKLQEETSNIPLRVPGPSGKERPVDLRLKEHNREFTPAAPLVASSIARYSGAGVTIGSAGLRLTLVGADVPGDAINGQDVVFSDVGRDMDAVVAPKLRGADLSVLLRSKLSPEEYRYQVNLPTGESLHASDGGAVITRDGDTVVNIPAPTARDAQNSSVPVKMIVVNNDLVVRVASHQANIAYPVLVDPELVVVNMVEYESVWQFHYESEIPLYCEGEPSGSGFVGCKQTDGMYSGSGLGRGPLTVTAPSLALPTEGERYNETTKEKESVEIFGGRGELWFKPTGKEGIKAVEFTGISTSGTSSPTQRVEWGVFACEKGQYWTSTESAPSSVRLAATTKHSCNGTSLEWEPVGIVMFTNTGKRMYEKLPPEYVGGQISVEDVLVTRYATGE